MTISRGNSAVTSRTRRLAGAGIAAAFLATGSLAGCTSTPEVTPSATDVAPTLAPEPAGLEREANVTDDVIIERMAHPRTGESWHEPIALNTDLELMWDEHGSWLRGDTYRYFDLGTRGDATIVAFVATEFNVWEMGHTIVAVFEVDDDGARFIACPSARVESPCTAPNPLVDGDRFEVDTETFYDTLTMPEWITFGDGQAVMGFDDAVPIDAQWSWGSASLFEDGFDWAYEPELAEDGDPIGHYEREIARIDFAEELGAVPGTGTRVVELSSIRQIIPGVRAAEYGIVMAHGGLVRVPASGMDGFGIGPVTWDDGTPTTSSVIAVTPHCFAAPFSYVHDFYPDQWKEAGTTPDGRRVYLPVDGDNQVAHAAFDYFYESSWGDDTYPYSSVEEFVADRAVFAYPLTIDSWDRWVVAMDAEAGQRVWECA